MTQKTPVHLQNPAGHFTPPLLENKDSNPQVPPTGRGWRLLLPKRREKQSTQYTLQQIQSPLFECFPTEIRLLIWEHYLCSRMLHIVVRSMQHKWRRPKNRIIGVLCIVPCNFCPCSHHCQVRLRAWDYRTRRERIQYFDELSYSVELETRRVDFVPHLQSCRRVVVRYSEVVDIIFQKNTFHFEDTYTIIEFSHTLLPQRLGMIRTLQLSFPNLNPGWNRCCEILATKLPGLKTLTIRLYDAATNHLDGWLRPLYQIQQPTVFKVLVTKPWDPNPQLGELIRLADAPFRIELVERDSVREAHCYIVT
ncbi:hypothetical protein N7519_003548 [Penicillium mononematosum]|uniref:uncharacterized protein n=1 Tax=Penicillium mononematosum TaxID=268346 RepID=UPI002546E5E4|nr:uncharacterized protein N7519_003548 [Penicillium mononematosum]KAJ6188640.1 hypothetical protein N7519_003548 [Penicillium mononematosum]